jgi:hypothetical protein
MFVNTFSGPDAIHAKLLKLAYDIISKPLCAIFNINLITKHFPNKWKLVNVTPVHKKQDKNIIGNYRPISLLPFSALTVFQDDSFPFIATLCFLLVKKILNHKSKFPTIPFFLI